jgi:hypothetical protein
MKRTSVSFFSVILSAAKDLMPVASGDEVLRYAQDDSGGEVTTDFMQGHFL